MKRNKRNGQPDGGVCDIQHMVHSDELFVIRQHKRNGQPDQCLCDIRHAVQSDELFVIRQHKRNGQPDEGVCDIQHMVHSDELFVIRQHKRNGQPDQGVWDIRHAVHSALSSVCDLCGNRSLPTSLFLYSGHHPPPLRFSLSIWNCCCMLFLPPFAFTLPSGIVRSSSPWREQAKDDPVILAPI